MNNEQSRQIARERVRIRAALRSGPQPRSDAQRALESVLAAVAAATPGNGNRLPASARRQVGRAFGQAFLHDFDCALARHASIPATRDQMAKELSLIEFGIRVLELEEGGAGRDKALGQASIDLEMLSQRKGEALDIRSLFDRFRQFKRLVYARGFVPHFSLDLETGEMAPTRFVPAHLQGRKGRPPEL